METFIDVCGFIGSWLLVAGPIYQATLELRDNDIEREHIEHTRQLVPKQRTSPWWWLLPPAMIIISRRRDRQYRQEFIKALPDETVESLVNYLDKATGWLYVATGGIFLATAETYNIVHHFQWNILCFWLIVPALAILCVVNAILRTKHTTRILNNK